MFSILLKHVQILWHVCRKFFVQVAEGDDILGESYLEGAEITEKMLEEAIRRATLARTFIPVYMGTLSVVCCLLPAACCLLSAVCCLLFPRG
jgi:translation elongation factor EF-G